MQGAISVQINKQLITFIVITLSNRVKLDKTKDFTQKILM